MKRYLFAAVALLLALPVVAAAQPRRDRGGRDDRSERIGRTINDCEDRTNDFLRAVERSWGRERHNGDALDHNAQKLERSLNRIRDSWNRDHRTRRNVGAAIDAGRDINRMLPQHRLGSQLDREWGAIKSELNNLAEVFDQPRIRW